MTGRIEEHDSSARKLYIVGGDMLGNTTRFAVGNIGLADHVK